MSQKSLLLLIVVMPALACADGSLSDFLRGTDTTPELSGLQISVMEGGEVTTTYAYGFAQITGTAYEPLRNDHKLRVASISKLIVAIGIMKLVDADILNLDRDVSDYLSWNLRNPNYPQEIITVRQLLSHTSSLRDGDRYFIAYGEGKLRDFFIPSSDFWDDGVHFASGANKAPGHYFVYSNLNFGVLGEVIEQVSGRRFDLYMEEAVLKPMSLTARFNPCEIPKSELAATFRKHQGDGQWAPEGNWVPQVDAGLPICFYGMETGEQPYELLASYETGSNASLFSPQGGLRASTDDLLLVLQMLYNGGVTNQTRILSEASVAEMLENEWVLNIQGSNGLSAGEAEPGGPTDGLMTSYGLSVHRINLREYGFDLGPEILVGHLGEAYGLLSHALLDPKTGDGIATIISGTGDDPAKFPGHSPLYRIEEEILRWWLKNNY